MRLLVIEDEPRIAEILKSGLQRAGFTIDVVSLCADAREALAMTVYDAAILDLGLPDGDRYGPSCTTAISASPGSYSGPHRT